MEFNMHKWASDLFPINRSLTGEGVRSTLTYLKKIIPELTIHEVPTGYEAFDWEVPKEWNISEAYIEDEKGNRIIDFKDHNLHVVGYSIPVDKWLSRDELLSYVYTLPDQPETIPYVTSYYKERWGFCMTHKQRESLPEGKYRAVIKSQLKQGVLNYADLVIEGDSDDEIMFSTYVCHPSMANNELSGPVLATALAKYLTEKENLRYTYRFVFVPETIGSIVYLSKHIKHLKEKIAAGFVLTCVGDERTWSFMPSRTGETYADKTALFALNDLGIKADTYSFLERGSDERQYCSPLVDLPVASVMRSKYGTYPEYHTSADDLELVTQKGLEQSFEYYKYLIQILEKNVVLNAKLPCEPQLGKRGLYPDLSKKDNQTNVRDILNVIAYADGKTDLIKICKICNLSFNNAASIARTLIEKEVLLEKKIKNSDKTDI